MFGSQKVSGFQAGQYRASMSNECDMLAGTFHIGETERNEVLRFWHFPLLAIEQRVLHKHDGVVIADGGLQKTLCIVSCCRGDDL